MSGGLVQLVATGAQDTWLTGKPEISFFRSNYKRYTHYALSTERQIIQGNPSAGSISTIRFEKKGDLLSYVYFIGKDTTGALIPGIDWSKVVDKIELLIGGQVVDTQDITWMTQVEPVTGAQNYSQRYLNNDLTGLTNVINGFLPLKFFFCKDWSVSLPLVALQYHDVELRITWNSQLNYRVNYEIYTISTGGAGIATATAQTTPVTGSGASKPIGSAGASTMNITNAALNQIQSYQPSSFAYSAANFQLVPGMILFGASGGTIAGATQLTVISVTATNTTSGIFYGAFSGGTSLPNQATLTTVTPVYVSAYSATTVTPATIGAPFILQACTVPGSAGASQLLNGTFTFVGYPSLGMSCTNLPVSAGGGTAYITAMVPSTTLTSTTVTVSFTNTATQISSISGLALGFSPPAASTQATLTPVQIPNVAGGGLPSFTPTFGTAGTAGQLQSVALTSGGTGMIPGTYLATFTLATQTSASSFSFVVPSTGVISATPAVVTAGAGALTGSQSAITNSAIAYSAYGTTVSYTLAASAVQNGVIFPGQSIPVTGMPTGTVGTGYVSSVIPGNIAGSAPAAQAGYVGSIIVTYAAAQSVTTTSPVSVSLFAPTSVNVGSTGGKTDTAGTPGTVVYATTAITGGIATIGMSIAGISGTTGTGYIYAINGATTVTPTQTTSVSIIFPGGSTTGTPTNLSSQLALPPVGSVQSTVAGQSVYTNVPIYGLGTGKVAIPVNSIISSNPPSVTGSGGTTIFQVSAISYQSAGVALATLTLYGTAGDGSGSITATNVSSTNPLLSGASAPVFTPSFPVVNLLLSGTPSGTITTGSTVLGQVTVGNNPLGTVNTVYGAITGFGYMVSVNRNQVLTAGMPAADQDGYYTAISLSFVPSSYQCGILTSASMPTYTSSGGKAGPITFTQGSGGTPSVGSYVYTTPTTTGTGTVLTNPTITPTTTSSQLYISYTAATAGTAWPQYSQFAIIPTASIYSQLSTTVGSGQPGVDRQGSAIISLAFIAGSGAVAVGQAVIGTQYAGPVTVSQVVSTSGTYAGTNADIATIEIQFPVQSKQPNTQTGSATFIQFVDPTQPLPATVSVSTTGFNGTYQQLQYEAWCSYLYLDQAEREYFASTPTDMIITQVNRVPINPLMTHEVNLAHPVKFLAFVSNSYATAYATQTTSGIPASSYQFKTQINGVDVGDSRSLFQWQDVPQYYHTPYGYKAATGTVPVTLISYCLDTSKLQPTGTLNFSRLDSYRIITPSNSTLAQIAGGATGYIYAMNYNILRIQKGMGAMLYSS